LGPTRNVACKEMEAAGDPDGPRHEHAGERRDGPDGGRDRSVLVAAGIGLLVTIVAGAGSVAAVGAGRPTLAAGLFAILLVFLAALSLGTDGDVD